MVFVNQEVAVKIEALPEPVSTREGPAHCVSFLAHRWKGPLRSNSKLGPEKNFSRARFIGAADFDLPTPEGSLYN